MAFTVAAYGGTSNNTTDVQIMPTVSSGQVLQSRTITIYNKDTANAEVTIKFDDGSNERILFKVTLSPKDTLVLDDPHVLSSTSHKLEMVLSGAVTSNQLTFYTSYGINT